LDQDLVLLACRDLQMDSESSKNMRAILSLDGVGRVLLGELSREEASLKTQLASANMTTEDDINKVRTLQARAKGIARAIDIIFEIANYRET
jgi:hypothetical protein